MKATLVALLATGAIAGAAAAQDDPDQSFVPGPPASDQTPPPQPNDNTSTVDHGSRGSYLTADMLGDQLAIDELNGAWIGTWTRRPGTTVFDAVWHNQQGQEAHDVIRLVGISGGQVTFRRDGVSGPAGGTYTGTLGPDGSTILGSASWYQPGWVWKAVIGGPAQGVSEQDRGGQVHGGYDRRGDQSGQGHSSDHGSHRSYQASEVQLFDNWNTGGCGLTDTASLDLRARTHVTRVTLWYNWRAGENAVRYTVSSRGRQVGGGTLTRGDCDPYQSAWCEARDTPDADLDSGRYTFRLESGRVCQNDGSGGAGFIKVWGYDTGR